MGMETEYIDKRMLIIEANVRKHDIIVPIMERMLLWYIITDNRAK
jgi:hypothetical protein